MATFDKIDINTFMNKIKDLYNICITDKSQNFFIKVDSEKIHVKAYIFSESHRYISFSFTKKLFRIYIEF